MRVQRQGGFTLTELLVVIFLIGFLVITAVPFIRQGTRDSAANAAARELYVDLSMARNEAIRTGLPHLVELCATPPGYMIFRCSNGVPPGPSYNENAPCSAASVDVCAELALTGTFANANLVREVVLGQNGTPARSNVVFGVAGTPTAGTPRAPNAVPASGIDLGDCDGTAARRFFYSPRGQMVDDGATGATPPCTGAIYLTGANNDDIEGNRAVELTSVGTARVFRGTADGGWE